MVRLKPGKGCEMNRKEHLLTVAGEEALEVAHRISKAKRFGLAEVQPGQSLDNAQRILEEWHDLQASVELLMDEGLLPKPDPTVSAQAKQAKREKIERFLAYSRQCGTLTEP